jgi:hypothetical protein
MKQENENSSATDPTVSAAYRAIATETPPSRLDDIVLRKATQETKSNGGIARYLNPVRRPIAFAATLVLALGIVLQFDNVITGTAGYSTGGASRPGGVKTSAQEISAVIDAGAEQIQQQMEQDERIMSQRLLNQPTPEATATADTESPDAARSCNSEQTVSVKLWWDCITDLEINGRYDVAAHERALLTNTYPDFLPAE